jgi:glucosamine--fructose-6-phosphate aminotransferase (isomerizing)
LILEGHDFISDTDTEVMVHLIEKFYTGSLEEAVRKALTMIRGSFAMVAICSEEPDCIVTAKKDSPLIVGLGEGENYVASDIPAILGKTRQVYIMDENEFAVLTPRGVTVSDFEGKPVEKKAIEVDWDPIAAEKGGYEHFMLKEIYEQPKAIRDTLAGKFQDGLIDLSSLNMDDKFRQVGKIFMVACGTAYHAALVGRLAIEKLARIPVETDIASEFRYRDVLWNPQDLMIVVSQSGETADTLAALREAKRQGITVLAVTNVVGSSVAREARYPVVNYPFIFNNAFFTPIKCSSLIFVDHNQISFIIKRKYLFSFTLVNLLPFFHAFSSHLIQSTAPKNMVHPIQVLV